MSATARIYRARRPRARTTDRGPPGRRLVRAELPQPRARASIRRSRSTTSRSRRAGRHLRAGDRRRLRACRRALHRRGDRRTARTIWTRAAQAIVDGGLSARQRRQPDRSDRPRSTSCRRARRASCSGSASELPLPPLLEARMVFDGYRIVREVHGSSRSHIYLAVDSETDDAGRHQDSLDRSAGRSGLPQALHDGGVGRAAHQQRPCPQAASRSPASATICMSSPNSSTGRRLRNG